MSKIGMSAKKLNSYLERFTGLEARRKTIEFDHCVLCKDLRGEFPTGDRGDAQLRNWLKKYLNYNAYQCNEALFRATVGHIAPTVEIFSRLGGYAAVKRVIDCPREEQVAILEVAKVDGKSIITLMRERGHYASSTRQPSDAEILAEFIQAKVRNPPPEILAIVRRHVRAKKPILKSVPLAA